MIHHTYNSSIISLRASFSYNGYAYCPNQRCPSNYCSCCCSFPIITSPRFVVPINPSFLYGLSQSTLIQCPPSRRLILGSADLYCFRSPDSDVGRSCNGECCCVKRERDERSMGERCKEECCVKKRSGNVNSSVNADKVKGRIARRGYRYSAIGDAEAMLSLLTEVSVEECSDVRERRRSLSKGGNVIREQRVVSEDLKSRKENSGSGYVGGRLSKYQLELEIGKNQAKEDANERREEMRVRLEEERRRSRRNESCSVNVGGHLDKLRLELSGKSQDREERYRRREDSENILKEEERRSRRNESSSSYCSASDTSDSESEMEIEIQDDRFVGKCPTIHGEDSRQTGSVVVSERNKKESTRYRDERDQRLQSNVHADFRVGSSAVSDSRKKSEGVVISEQTKTDSKRYIDQRKQQLRTSRDDDVRVGSTTEWDYRKKSEKRLTDESVEEAKSGKGSIVRHSQMSQAHESSSMEASRLEKQFNYQQEESTSGESFDGQLRSCVKKDNQVGEHSKSSARHEWSTQTAGHNYETASNMQITNQGQEGMMLIGQAVQETGCEYCKTCGRSMQQNEAQAGFQQRAELSHIRDGVRVTSTVHGHSGSRLKKQEKSSALYQTSVQEMNEHLDQMVQASTSQVNARRKMQNYRETVDAHDSYVESASSSQQQSESHMKNSEGSSGLLISTQKVEGQLEITGDIDIKGSKSSRVAQSRDGASQVHTTNTEINRQTASEKHIYNEQIYITKMKSEEELVEKHKYIDETTVCSRHRTEEQRPTVEATFSGEFLGDASTSQPSTASTSKPSTASIPQIGAQEVSEAEANFALQLSTLPPSGVQLNSSMRYDSGEITQSGTDIVDINRQGRTPSASDLVSTGSESYLELSHEDALGSAERMGESSLQIVGGFVEEMRHETSTSHTRMEKTSPQRDPKHQLGTSSLYLPPQATTSSSSEEGSGYRGESYEEPQHEEALISAETMEESAVQVVGEFVKKMKHEASISQSTMKKSSQLDSRRQDDNIILKGYTRSDEEKTIIQKQESRRSSGGSETKGPSDDMWDAKDHFGQESSEIESSEGVTSQNVSVKRTGKSLWNVVSDVFRLQWGSQAKAQKSSVKEGGHGSSNDSASGEASSSGDEADEGSRESESVPEEQTSFIQPLKRRTSTKSQREDLGAMISDDILRHAEMGASSSSSVLQSGSLSGGISSGVSTNWNVSIEGSQPTTLDLTQPPTRRLVRSNEFKEIEEAGHSEGLIESTEEPGVLSTDVRQTGKKPVAEVTDTEAKQKKLKRSNQVLHIRYDEWETAYRLEREQRKVDEIFMREALVEAKKAADLWEVPVGAVLVQNGNVIARGYNLVEELRDSTAHAEIICIREASNALRTWRLLETTLYVTLEPCPMCAGAILQARVGTLVWGAPNKLLGADGSWIRLFPDVEEGERPEVAEKPAAPAHPFHPNMKIRRGVLEEECADIMQQFFQLRRRKEKKSRESSQKQKLLHKMFPALHKKRSS